MRLTQRHFQHPGVWRKEAGIGKRDMEYFVPCNVQDKVEIKIDRDDQRLADKEMDISR